MHRRDANPFTTKTKLGLGHLYESNIERSAYHIELYRKLYDLPSYRKEESVTPELYAYCRQRNFFVNIVAFQARNIFLTRSMGERLGWSLPGSSILSKKDELFQDAVYRIISRDIPNIEIGELRPIAYLEKIYFLEKESATHRGITFMARVRHPSQEEIDRNEDIKGRFISIDDTREVKRISSFDAELFTLASSYIDKHKFDDYDSIEDEISSFDRITPFASCLHKYVIGPIGKIYSSRLIKREILKYIKPTDFFLDIACGDDNFIWQLAEKTEFCVANDIQWKLIKKLISSQSNYAHKVIFVNHDACDLPFKKRFDLVLCKNILHHMDTQDQLVGLLSSLQDVSKRILIIDPEDPSNNALSKLWHNYYVRLLKDQGRRFFSMNFLKKTLKEFYSDASKIEVKKVFTIKGYYLFCLVEFNDNNGRDLSITTKMDDRSYKLKEILDNRKAIIFDFDGLLFDTERLFIDAVRSVLHQKGIAFQDKDYINMDLQNGTSMLDHFLEVGILDNVDHLQAEIYAEYDRLVNLGVIEMPGAKKVIEGLFGRYRLAIASSSKRAFINKILHDHGLYDKFDFIVSRENTNRLKPDPECLKLIMRQLGLRSDECVLVEDTIRGLKAAKTIGMRCIIVPNELTRGAVFEGADLVINALPELITTVNEE